MADLAAMRKRLEEKETQKKEKDRAREAMRARLTAKENEVKAKRVSLPTPITIETVPSWAKDKFAVLGEVNADEARPLLKTAAERAQEVSRAKTQHEQALANLKFTDEKEEKKPIEIFVDRSAMGMANERLGLSMDDTVSGLDRVGADVDAFLNGKLSKPTAQPRTRESLEAEALNDPNIANPGFVKTDMSVEEMLERMRIGQPEKETVGDFTRLAIDTRSDFTKLDQNSILAANMTDTERYTYSYFLGRDNAKADAYLDMIREDVNKRATKKMADKASEFSSEHPLAGAVASVLLSPASNLSMLPQFAALITGTEYDSNGAFSMLGNVSDALKEGSLSEIENPVLRIAAGSAISVGENFVLGSLAGSKTLSRIMMASNSAAATARAKKADGSSDVEAAVLAVVAGTVEYLTEAIGVDEVYDSFFGDGMKELLENTAKRVLPTILKEIGKNSASEATEELISEVVNNVADTIVRGDKSEYQTLVNKYIADNYSEEDAKKMALNQLYFYNVGAAALGGAFAGGGSTALGSLANARTYTSIARRNRIIRKAEKASASRAANGGDLATPTFTPEQSAQMNADFGAEAESRGKNRLLEESELEDYIRVGKTLHTRNKKMRMLEAGKKPILTTIDAVKKFISDAIKGNANGEVRAYGVVGSDLANAILDADSSLDVEGRYIEINADDLRESYKRHSQPKEQGDIALNEDDFQNIPKYLDEFDGVLGVNKYNEKVEIHLYKELDDGYVRILTVSSKERDSLIISKLIGVSKEKFETKYGQKIEKNRKNAGSPRGQNAPIPNMGARLTAGVPSDTIISQSPPIVKGVDDAATVEDFASQYGEQAQAFVKTYELGGGNQDVAAFAAQYEMVYSYGVEGIKPDYVNSEHFKSLTSELTDAQRELAYSVGRDIYEAKRVSQTEAAQKAVDEAVAKAKERVNGNARIRYSIKYDIQNTPYVDVQNDVLANVPKKDWVSTIKKHIPTISSVEVGNSSIKINRTSKNEYLHSKYTDRIAKNDASKFKDKLNLIQNIDEVIQTTRNYINEGLNHPRKDNIIQFARGKTNLRIGTNEYQAEVVVGYTSGGTTLLYDVVNLTPSVIYKKSRRTNKGNVQNAESLKMGASDTNIISQTESIVNSEKESFLQQDYSSSRGKVHISKGVSASTSLQKVSIKSLKVIADAFGINIYVYDSKNPQSADEKYSDGWYDSKTSSIHLDVHAGKGARGTMIYTAAHELTHLIKDLSPVKYKIFSDFLIEQYAKKGVSLDALIDEQIRKAEVYGDAMSRAEALDEVIADSCERMLLDSNSMEKLSELAARGKEERGLVAKIRDYFKKLFDNLREVYRGLDTNTTEAKHVSEMVDAAEQLYALFEDALVDAAQVSRTLGEAGVEVDGESDIKRARKKADDTKDRNVQFNRHSVETALWDAFDHSDEGYDNLIKVSDMPRYIVEKFGIDGDIYIYRNHAYENMVSKKDAEEAGRPTKRGRKDIHFHNLGIEKMTDALLSINDPTMVIDDTQPDGHPEIIMLLSEFGNNGAPLYAAISFYANQNINGQMTRKPHLILTIAERNYIENDGRRGYEQIIKEAIENGKILDYNKKRGDDLSVIAQHTRLGNITEASLNDSIARFRKNVKDFREKNKIYYSRKSLDDVSPRALLADAMEAVATNDIERQRLAEYKAKLSDMEAAEERLYEVNSEIKELSFAKGKRDVERIRTLMDEKRVLETNINTYDKMLLRLENARALQGVVEREKKKVQDRAKAREKAAVKAQRERDEARYNAKLEEYRERRRASEAKIRAERDEKLEAQKEHFKAVRENERERRAEAKLREKIKNFKAKLEKSLLSPTESQYVPQGLADAMIEVCGLIDTDTELYKPDGSVNKAQEKREQTKAALQALKDEYERLRNSPDPMYSGEFDESVYEYLGEIRDAFAGKSLTDMTLSELEEFYDSLIAIGETLADARKLIGYGEAVTAYEVGDGIIAEQKAITSKRRNGKRSAAQKGVDALNVQSLSPVRAVERMSGYIKDSNLATLFNRFVEGERKKKKFIMDSYLMFEKLTTGDNAKAYAEAIYKPTGKIYTDKDGREFSVTKMQMMQAILSREREVSNKKTAHIENGGIKFADVKMLQKGDIGKAISAEYAHTISGESAIKLIESFKLELAADEWAQAYMTAAREYFNGMAKDAINETTLVLMHRIVAKEKAYIPFEVDQNFVVKEISSTNDIQQTVNSYGMLKELQQNAGQPLVMTGLNNVLDRHINEVGTIYGIAIPARDFNKVWNVKSSAEQTSVKDSLQRNWGADGVKLVEQAVKDVQGPRVNKQSAVYRKIKSNYIISTFLLNLSVLSKQICSMFASTSMLRFRDPVSMMANLAYTMAHSEKIAAEVNKYTATAWMRGQGLSDAELRTLATEAQKGAIAKLADRLPTALNPQKWITAMDYSVALSLWKYAKEDVAAKTGLEGEALLQATAEFYDEVVENTQSMSDVLHRPEIQKSHNVFAESFAMFKTDLYQMAGQLQNAAGRYAADKSKENGAALGRTVYSVIASAAWNQLMTVLFAAIRYQVKRYRDDEDELTAESWLKRMGFGLAGDFAGYIMPLFGSELVGGIESLYYGESNDFANSIVLDAVNGAISAITTAADSIKDGEWPSFDKMRNVTVKALQLAGLPANNVARIVNAITLHARDIANGEFLSFKSDTTLPKGKQMYIAAVRDDIKSLDKLRGTYKDEKAYETAMKKTLRENDERIAAAAEARLNGDLAEYKRILYEIVDEGHFDAELVAEAIFAEEEALEKAANGESEAEDEADGDTAFSIYKASDVGVVLDSGDTDEAKRIIEELIEVKVANGSERKNAESSIKSALTSHYKEEYIAADDERRKEIRQLLWATGLYKKSSDVVDLVNGWVKNSKQ